MYSNRVIYSFDVFVYYFLIGHNHADDTSISSGYGIESSFIHQTSIVFYDEMDFIMNNIYSHRNLYIDIRAKTGFFTQSIKTPYVYDSDRIVRSGCQQ